MRAAHSPEITITNALRDLGCGGRAFVEIARASGISVSQGGYSEVMNEKKDFQRAVAEQLLDLIDQMKKLKRFIDKPRVTDIQEKGIPEIAGAAHPDWSNANKISIILAIYKLASIATEMGDSSFDEFAVQATESMRSKNVPR